MKKHKKPTIKDVARLADVSIGTVSKALIDSAKVKKTTREKVRNAAKQLRYFPNQAARTLRGVSSQSVTMLMCGGSKINPPQYSKILFSIMARCEEMGLSLTLKHFSAAESRSCSEFISDNPSDYYILIGEVEQELCIHIRENDFNGIVLGNINVGSHLPNLRVDGRKAGYLAVEYLKNKGCEKIIATHSFSDSPFIQTPIYYEQTLGYRDAIDAFDISVEAFLGSKKHLLAKLKGDSKIGVISPDDIAAAHFIYTLSSLGIHVPQDLAVIGMGNSLSYNIMPLTLTTVDFHFEIMGCRAVEIVTENYSQDMSLDAVSPQIREGETV